MRLGLRLFAGMLASRIFRSALLLGEAMSVTGASQAAALIALLGRRDTPTDALEDYCACLKQALAERGLTLETERLPWGEVGWPRALRWLWHASAAWQGQWILIQYTALAWSRRGIPLGLAPVIWILQRRRGRVAIVFHEPLPFGGCRLRDRIRRLGQVVMMRYAARRADRIISPIPPARIGWMRDSMITAKTAAIPVGSNVPERWQEGPRRRNGMLHVTVFGVTENHRAEASLIGKVVSLASGEIGPFRLTVVGRGALQAEPALRESLNCSGVELDVRGILPPEKLSDLLQGADALLFVRSGISSRRGSAVAGIACGLPVLAFSGEETEFPIIEAGVRLAPLGDVGELAGELIALAHDEGLRQQLSERSRESARRYFCWDVIASRFIEALAL
jgi:glycosyltransferase involved in cell wall biosynthesis